MAIVSKSIVDDYFLAITAIPAELSFSLDASVNIVTALLFSLADIKASSLSLITVIGLRIFAGLSRGIQMKTTF